MKKQNKLKTLKELEPIEERFVFRNEIEKEAIKCHNNPDFEQWTADDFIEWFFNLTEEDLK